MGYIEHHLIIGAGPVGLAVAKAFKEAGIAYDQVEADDDVGGNWYHGTYETAHIISSKKVTQYADWPMPEEYPDFPGRRHMLAYFRTFADHFKLREHIRFHKKVTYVRPVAHNHWEASFEDGEQSLYKGVVVCNGHHWCKRWPDYEGHFEGPFIHSKDYRHPEQLKGKRVLVIGSGNSACDIASEAARVGKQAYLSMRRGTWFFPKTLMGKPLTDLPLVRGPVWIQRLFLKSVLRLTQGDYRRYGLPKPEARIFDHHPTISDEVLHYIKHGRIIPKPAIASLQGGAVVFDDGSRLKPDLIVAATGFHVAYPFLPDELARVEGPVVKVYGGSMLDDYKGLYLVGWSQARGGIGSLIAPGARLLARMVLLQEEIEHPMGWVLKKSGVKLPHTHLMNPPVILRKIRRAHRFWKLLEWRARKLDNKFGAFENKILPPMPPQQKDKLMKQPLTVY